MYTDLILHTDMPDLFHVRLQHRFLLKQRFRHCSLLLNLTKHLQYRLQLYRCYLLANQRFQQNIRLILLL